MATQTLVLPGNEGFMFSEANGWRSREEVTIASGAAVIPAGTVLGKATASGKYSHYDLVNSDGLEVAVAILLSEADPTGGDVKAAVVVRDCEVNGAELAWPAGISVNDKAAAVVQLNAVGIIVRDGPVTISTQTT